MWLNLFKKKEPEHEHWWNVVAVWHDEDQGLTQILSGCVCGDRDVDCEYGIWSLEDLQKITNIINKCFNE